MKFVKRKEYGLASRLKKSAVSYAMMAPYMIVFILLTVIPVIAAICLSFTYFNMLEPPKFTGFLFFLQNDLFVKAWVTVIYSTDFTSVSYQCAYP